MATDKQIQATLNNFKELDTLLFDGGAIPTYEELFEKANAGEPFTFREAVTMRLYSEGVALAPSVINNEQTKERAKVFVGTFGKARVSQPVTMGGLRDQVQNVLKKGVTLDTPYQDLIEEARTTQVYTGVRKEINALNTSVNNFKKGSLSTVGKVTTKKFKRVPTKQTIQAIVKGIARIPDAELRDAVFISVFGMRGAQLADIAVDYETAVATESVRPYFDPETGILESPEAEYGTRKPLPPSKTMGPVATQILQRRHALAVEAGDTRLFPNVTSAKISNALSKYVFSEEYFPQKEVAHLGRRPNGITDLRKIFVSYTAKEMGDLKLADALLGHAETGTSSVDEAISQTGAKFYLTRETTGPEVYGNFLTRVEQDMAQAAGYDSFSQLADGMRVEFPDDVSVEFVNFDTAADDALLNGDSQVRPEVVERSPEEIKAAQDARLAREEAAAEEARRQAEEARLKTEQTKAERLAAQEANLETQESLPTKKEREAAKTAKRFGEISDKIGGALQGFFDDIEIDNTKGLVGLGLAGTLYGFSQNVEAFEEEGVGSGTAKVLAAGQTVYETLEPPTLTAVRESLRIGEAGSPESVLGTTEEQRAYAERMGGIETEFSRAQAVKESDRQQAVIAEQMGRIAEYDKRMASQNGALDQQMSTLINNISGD